MPIFRVKSVKIYTGQKNLHWRRQWRQWQLWGMQSSTIRNTNKQLATTQIRKSCTCAAFGGPGSSASVWSSLGLSWDLVAGEIDYFGMPMTAVSPDSIMYIYHTNPNTNTLHWSRGCLPRHCLPSPTPRGLAGRQKDLSISLRSWTIFISAFNIWICIKM